MEIRDIMMRSVETVEPDESLCEAARKMASQNIGLLPVWQDGALVGVVTDRDIVVRGVARGFDPEQTIVEEVMTSMVVSLPESSDLEDASDLMESKHVHRLVVIDDKAMPVGIVSLDKVALHLGVYALDSGLVRDPPAAAVELGNGPIMDAGAENPQPTANAAQPLRRSRDQSDPQGC